MIRTVNILLKKRVNSAGNVRSVYRTLCKLHPNQGENSNTARLIKLKETSARLINIEKWKSLQESSAAVIGQKKENFVKFVYMKITEWYEKYITLLGLDKIRILQDNVLQIENRLKEVKAAQRYLDNDLKAVRRERYHVDEALRKVDRIRDNERYVDLVRQEGKVIFTEKELELKVEEADKLERDTFTELSNAIAKSYEAGRQQAEHAKNFGYILSIVGVVLGAALSYAVNAARTRDLIDGLQNGMDVKLTKLSEKLDSHFENIIKRLAELKVPEFLQTKTYTSTSKPEPTSQLKPEPTSQLIQPSQEFKIIAVIALVGLVILRIFGS